jgi:predicted nucleotidyltransferase component of viral defense system
MDFAEIRRTTIIALFADDELSERLALKGGNALSLIHGITSRTSLDLDFSIREDFPDFKDAEARIFRALKDRFDSLGYVVFDERLNPKPRLDGPDDKPWWGGYELKFKLISKDSYERLRNRPQKMRIEALVTGARDERTFTVDLSKYEYTKGKQEHQLDHYLIYVYTPEMIVVEKLRAICQQMPEYPHKGHPRPRARDFYDIYSAVTRVGIDLTSAQNRELLAEIFEAKQVPLSLLTRIGENREFHRPDWTAVQSTVNEELRDFDFYFDFVLQQVEGLKPFGII